MQLPRHSSRSTWGRFIEAEIWNRIGLASKLTHFDASVDPRSTTILMQSRHWQGMMLAVFPVVDSYINLEPCVFNKMWEYV